MTIPNTFRPLAVILLLAAAQALAGQAHEILETTGVQGGLVVHVGCGDGKLTAALRANDSFLVHGLDTDPKHVEAARKHIQSLGLYGRVSVQPWAGERLPYVDNLVNLVVVSDRRRVPMEELLRVLVPERRRGLRNRIGTRTTTVKPWPAEIDDWTHFLHGPDNNAVAPRPPRGHSAFDPVGQRTALGPQSRGTRQHERRRDGRGPHLLSSWTRRRWLRSGFWAIGNWSPATPSTARCCGNARSARGWIICAISVPGRRTCRAGWWRSATAST